MIQLGIGGTNGRMGQALISAVERSNLFVATACHERGKNNLQRDFCFDVWVDFTRPDFTMETLEFCLAVQKPLVVGTTGLSSLQQKQLKQAAEEIPVLFSANMSVGINIIYYLLEKSVGLFSSQWDIAISETHHRHKVDMPSGTALALAEVIEKTKNNNSDIPITSIRAGMCPGEHSIMFASDNERIELTHRASDRGLFAEGALVAAEWLLDKKPGFYTMRDVLQAKIMS